jgi:hypothetical protein
MNAFGFDGFAAVRPVRVELITARYVVSGTMQTRFSRVAEILNQLTTTHLPIEDAAVHEHGQQATERAGTAIVAVDEILVMTAPDLVAPPAGGDMRVPKEPLQARLAIGPVWVSGSVYVPIGSRPIDGLLNVADRFVPMTDVVLSSAAYPDLDREAPVAAVRRDGAHVILFADASDDPDTEASSTATATESVTPHEQV